ncbi:unnamed protein product [Arctia plantaginis]|uniref:Peptidase S1 domain-containing protein n=1 Tax=Arctia plantaginis TaxID=874455 RepID=A0A8S1BHB7_ARCPL|nr:unnamed protein product [Arctia plantaginis]
MFFKLAILCCVLVLSDAAFEGDECDVAGVKGTCTLLPKCPSALNARRKGVRPQGCGFDGPTPIVCCLQDQKPTWRPPTITTTQRSTVTRRPEDDNRTGGCEAVPEELTSKETGQKAFDKCIEYQAAYVYPCENVVSLLGGFSRTRHCHHNVDKLVYGGNDTHIHEFPHMAMLGYEDYGQPLTYNCGGSIISDKFILTAAHCTFNTKLGEVKYVVVGALTRTDANNPSNVLKVRRIIKHPEYASPSQYHDIALLETEKRIPLSQFVVPACLHVGDPVTDDQVLATGWGLTENRAIAEVMQKVILSKFTTEECALKYPEYRLLLKGFDPQTQTCYGDKTKAVDTCQGDSGGPIQIKSKRINCMYILVGVTSFGRKCGVIAEPAIYTKVSYYVPWIESIVWP